MNRLFQILTCTGIMLVSGMYSSCSKGYKSSIPDMKFPTIQCDMRQAAYSGLRTPGYFITIDKNVYGYSVGYAGIIVGQSVFPDFDNQPQYYAFDRACPVEASPKVAVLLTGDGLGKAVCPNCKTEYDLNNGGVPTGKGKEFLKPYVVERRGADMLYIYSD